MKTTHSLHAPKMTRHQRLTLLSSAFGMGLENMDIMFIAYSLTSIIHDLGLTGAQAGLISSVTNIGMLVGGVFFGRLADKYGRVKIFTYTIFIFAFATAAMFFATNIYWIYLFRFLAGIGAGGEYGIGIALVAEAFPPQKVGKMSSIIGVSGQIGAIVAAILAAVLVPLFGWRELFLFGLIPVILAFIVRENLEESETWKNNQESGRQEIGLSELFGTKQLTRRTLSLMLMAIVQIAGYFGLMNWLPSIMQTEMGFSVAGSSYWMIATIIGMSLGMMVFGKFFDQYGPRFSFGVFLLASAVSVFVFPLATSPFMLLILGAVVGFFSNGMFGGYGAIVSLLYPTHVRSLANNLVINVGRAIGGFSSVAIGFLLDHYSLSVVMTCLSMMYLVSFVIMISLTDLKKQNFKHHQ
ncbi:MFS transporter [Vagococcus lutrae]|uniref:MFS transporter n=1 Tax=Vagococcus lutrae TaxID=81947 RepID=UPI002A7F80E3|nr:MFS transporter [Vagococcus lutrae]MDY3706433.1 MFS transporter [Vagococcus lutrae]